MNRIFLFLAAFATIGVLSSCTRGDELTIREKRLVGTWEIDEVKYFERWAISGDEQTNQYEGTVLTLNDDRTALLIEADTVVYEGDWWLHDEDDTDVIDLNLHHVNSDSSYHWLGQNVFVTRNKLRFSTEDASRGNTRYRWRK